MKDTTPVPRKFVKSIHDVLEIAEALVVHRKAYSEAALKELEDIMVDDVKAMKEGLQTLLTAPAVEPTDLIKRLRETASKGVSVWGDLQMEAAKEIEILTAERDALKADAERYRWLRDASGRTPDYAPTATLSNGGGWEVRYEFHGDRLKPTILYVDGRHLDAAIDAAMKGTS